MTDKADDPRERARAIENEIASRLRRIRISEGVSQMALADVLGITFQQLQKYEKAINRISPGRLWLLAEYFGVTIDYFFEPLPDQIPPQMPPRAGIRRSHWHRLYDELADDVLANFLQIAEHFQPHTFANDRSM